MGVAPSSTPFGFKRDRKFPTTKFKFDNLVINDDWLFGYKISKAVIAWDVGVLVFMYLCCTGND